MQINKLLTFALFALAPLSSHAAIYKWVDEHGNVQYSSEKPPEVQAEKVKVNTSTRMDSGGNRNKANTEAETDTATSSSKSADKTEASPADKKADAAKKAASDKEKKAMCDDARKALSIIQAGGRIRQEDEQGNISVMSDEEIKSRTKNEQERVNKYCK